MNFGQTVREQLYLFLTNEKPMLPGGQKYVFQQQLNDVQFRIVVHDFDKFSFQLESLELSARRESNISVEELEKRGNSIAMKITYLLEDFKVIELDANSLKLQLRSVSPASDNSNPIYFEMLLNAAREISLIRYQFNKEAQTRTRIPYHITSEVLIRLINDLAGALRD
jgi:hypothetical protein